MEYIMLLPVFLSVAALAFVGGLAVWDEITLRFDARPHRPARPAPRTTPPLAYATPQAAE